MPADGEGMRTGYTMDTIGAEEIYMTTQREVCVHLCVFSVFMEGLSDNWYKERERAERESRHLRWARRQLSLELSLTFVSACATASRLFKEAW